MVQDILLVEMSYLRKMKKLITILTATYNRAHLLPDLYQSLCRQTSKEFDWVIIDDGSEDGTNELVDKWLQNDNGFQIQYFYVSNGGKNRAINLGVKQVVTPYIMIVDSDDYLTDDAIEYLTNRLDDISSEVRLAGIAGLRGISKDESLHKLNFNRDCYVLANNLERKKYGLEKDACEVFRTDLLLSHPFEVWDGEKFVPEEIVWNQLALEGYSLRWYNKVTCIVRYQEGGMTKGSWELLKKNPMGYASMYRQRIGLSKSWKDKFYNNVQLITLSILGGHLTYAIYLKNLTALLAFPFGCLIALRRKRQYAKN